MSFSCPGKYPNWSTTIAEPSNIVFAEDEEDDEDEDEDDEFPPPPPVPPPQLMRPAGTKPMPAGKEQLAAIDIYFPGFHIPSPRPFP